LRLITQSLHAKENGKNMPPQQILHTLHMTVVYYMNDI